ncbi:hypothetical protein JXL21_09900, partial [Candidatus Bathyarchaeota archaeon]|nr:hypothetical protein [Candidatus Bathyarchaeota archaeon]
TGMQKFIEIYLNNQNDSVEINFKVRKLNYKLKRGVYWIFWIPIIEDFYRYMGVKIDRTIMARLYDKEYFDILIKGNIRYMYLLFSLLFIISIFSIAYMPIMLLVIGVPITMLLFINYNEVRILEKRKKALAS